MNSTAQAWEIARDIAARQGTGSKEWYGLAHYILTLPDRIEPIEQENDMNELIPLQTTEFNGESQRTVNARDLHAFLESERQFSNWITYQIEAFGFTQGIDYLVKNNFVLDATAFGGKRKTIDYHLTIDMAKELAMVERSAKGKEARLYFIECERIAKQVKAPAFNIPQTYAAALQLAADQARQLEAAQPAIEFHERVGDDEGLHSIDEVAKALNAPPMKFRAALKKELDLFRLDGLPKQTHINDGYMRVIETVLPNGRIYPQPMFTGKGMIWVQQRLDHNLMGVQI